MLGDDDPMHDEADTELREHDLVLNEDDGRCTLYRVRMILCVGTTGSGKTLLLRALAENATPGTYVLNVLKHLYRDGHISTAICTF